MGADLTLTHFQMEATATQWLDRSLVGLQRSSAARPEPAKVEGCDSSTAAVIVLNTPLPADAARRLWAAPQVKLRVAADGGANRLAAAAPELTLDVVVGDLDSASAAVLDRFIRNGAKVLDQRADQDTTDLEKALTVVLNDGRCKQVYVLGEVAGVDGRLDHTFATLNALFKFQEQLQVLQLLLLRLPLGCLLACQRSVPMLMAVLNCCCCCC